MSMAPGYGPESPITVWQRQWLQQAPAEVHQRNLNTALAIQGMAGLRTDIPLYDDNQLHNLLKGAGAPVSVLANYYDYPHPTNTREGRMANNRAKTMYLQTGEVPGIAPFSKGTTLVPERTSQAPMVPVATPRKITDDPQIPNMIEGTLDSMSHVKETVMEVLKSVGVSGGGVVDTLSEKIKSIQGSVQEELYGPPAPERYMVGKGYERPNEVARRLGFRYWR